MEKVSVANGKYTVCLPDHPGESLRALRYGEDWRDCCGDNLILLLASELNETRVMLRECVGAMDCVISGGGSKRHLPEVAGKAASLLNKIDEEACL